MIYRKERDVLAVYRKEITGWGRQTGVACFATYFDIRACVLGLICDLGEAKHACPDFATPQFCDKSSLFRLTLLDSFSVISRTLVFYSHLCIEEQRIKTILRPTYFFLRIQPFHRRVLFFSLRLDNFGAGFFEKGGKVVGISRGL